MDAASAPGTEFIASAAGAIGSGVVVGGFVGGLLGLMRRGDRGTVEASAFYAGYCGGFLAALAWLAER